MAEEKGMALERTFEQPADAISFYCDYALVVQTGNEVILQFYETIPGVPVASGGGPKDIKSRLRATITVSYQQAKSMGNLLTEKVGK